MFESGIFAALLLWSISLQGQVLALKEESSSTLPVPPICGRPLSDRLIGGIQSQIDEIPWTALLEYRKPNGQTGFHCGGLLINSRYVLTAAHCVKAFPKDWILAGVRLGEWDLDMDSDCSNNFCNDAPVNVGIEKIVVHENYVSNRSHYNDIALIRFNTSVQYSDLVSPVCLPTQEPQLSQKLIGTKGYTSGWGRTDQGVSNVKLKVPMEISATESCANIYRRLGVTLTDKQICAKGFNSHDSHCNTPLSGSPFTKEEYFENYRASFNYVYGFASMGPRNCGANDMPDVYTNVAKYVDWIRTNLQ